MDIFVFLHCKNPCEYLGGGGSVGEFVVQRGKDKKASKEVILEM